MLPLRRVADGFGEKDLVMIKLKYFVHTASQEDFTAKATVAGVERDVKVPGLAVEMVSEDGSMSHTFRFVPDDMEKAVAAFEPESAFIVSIAPAKD